MNFCCQDILATKKHARGLFIAVSPRLENGQQIPGVSAATPPSSSSRADVANHSRCFPAEPTWTLKSATDKNQLI